MRLPELPSLEALGPDLVLTSLPRRALVLARPFAGALGFALAWSWGHPGLALGCVFFVFVGIVSSAHDVVHGSLGLSRRASDVWLFLLGALVLESGHAYRLTHLRHHAIFPGPDDPEGAPAKMSLLGALLHGPVFLPKLWWWALRRASSSERRWLLAEAAWAIGVALVAMILGVRLLLAWVALVVAGSFSYPLLTAHLPHRHFGDSPLTQTHTLRGRIIPRLFLELTYHLEHHLYPRVPTHLLPELAKRLEPTLKRLGVEPWRVP
ncbi:MAG: fatty acid desaturase [Myxococcota bacterium]